MRMASVGITLLVGICLVVLAAACGEGEEEATATPTATATATATAIASPTESPTPTAARYEVTVRFNTSVTQDDIDEVSALLRAYDDDLEFLIMELWPPIGRALLATNVANFCQAVEAKLKAKSYVDDASCGPA